MCSLCILTYIVFFITSHFGSEGGTSVLIASVTGHCFSFSSMYYVNSLLYEVRSIYNGNKLITQPTNALEFYAIYGTIGQGLPFRMMHKHSFIFLTLLDTDF